MMNKKISQTIWKRFMFVLLVDFISLVYLAGCDTAYRYDIEDGIDDNSSDTSSITVNTEEGIDMSMYEQARIFPGLVDTAREERVNAVIELDLSKIYVDSITLGIHNSPKSIYSTGLYAGAGEQIVINVEDDVNGLTVIIGPHMQDLTTLNPYQRFPVVSLSKMLFPGKNIVKNPLGGLIWIKKSEGLKDTGTCRLNFEGVYQSADYVRGETNVEEWKRKIAETTVPWLEIRGDHFAFTLPKDRVLDNIEKIAPEIEEVTAFWDVTIAEFYYHYYGLTPGGDAETGERAPDFPVRVVMDVLLLDNLYLSNASSNEAIVTINSDYMLSELLDLKTIRSGNSIALARTLNDMFTYRNLRNPWPSRIKTVADAIPLYRMGEKGFPQERVFGQIFPGEENITTLFPKALDYAVADSSKWFGNDPETIISWSTTYKAFDLLKIVQLANYHGNDWEFMRAMNIQAKKERVIDNAGDNGVFYFFKALCDYFQQDFSPFYDRWGMNLPDGVRAYASTEKQYPLMDEEIWKYDPLAANPAANVKPFEKSKYPRRHDRRGWEVKAFGKNYSEDNYIIDTNNATRYSPMNIIDGNKTSYWQSYFKSTYIEGTEDPAEYEYESPELPFYIVVKLDKITDIDGIYLANGSECYFNLSGVTVEYMQDSGDPYDENAAWQSLATLNWTSYDARLKNERFFEVPRTTGVRALRLVIDKPNTLVFNEDANPEWVEHEERRYSLAEFGTFYYSAN